MNQTIEALPLSPPQQRSHWPGSIARWACWCGLYLSILYGGTVTLVLLLLYRVRAFDEPKWQPILVSYVFWSATRHMLFLVLVPALFAGALITSALYKQKRRVTRIVMAWFIVSAPLEGILALRILVSLGPWQLRNLRDHPSFALLLGFDLIALVFFPIVSLLLTVSGYYLTRRLFRKPGPLPSITLKDDAPQAS